ncbi:GGDEF domain-containing protein [Actinoplanes sp. NPDC051494]|uniref:GGDEF domain-containing protein n=1 Tax=Actinoplanes sp. NPDC051494 TaxID=3363907 RepID=UPI00378B87C2
MRLRRGMSAVGRPWFLYTAVLAIAILGYFRVPDTWAQTASYDAIAVSGILAMAIGVRRNRAAAAGLWIMLAGCKLIAVCGDLSYAWYARHLHLSLYPAPADGFYLTGGALEIVVLVLILRRRLPARDPGGVIEAVILTGSAALVAWVFLLKPATQDDGLTAVGRLVAISYPIIDLLLVMLLARILIGGGVRNGAFRLLACGMISYLVADYAWAFTNHFQFDAGTFASHLLDAGYLLAFGLYGAAGLHPGIRDLAEPVQVTDRGFSRWRLALLTSATMIAPALLTAQAWSSHNQVADATAIAGGCVAMFLLVVARMTVLIRQVERQASVLENQAEELTELAQRDTLTGLPNRRAWEQRLPLALDHARRDGNPLSLAVIDLDLFKRFNDEYGHQAGDRLLKEAAAAWTSGLRAGDLLVRYGGEEFALVVETGGAQAGELLDRLRPLTPSGQTFSAGVAVWDGQEPSDALFARADAALYEAKRTGRDRVALAMV